MVHQITEDVNNHILPNEVESPSFQAYLSSFVFPLFSTLSLIPISFNDWISIADHCIMVIKRIELYNMQQSSNRSLDFFESLLCHFLFTERQSLSMDCHLDAIQNGFNSIEMSKHHFLPITNHLVERELIQFLQELIEGTSSRMSSFYTLLDQSVHVPSAVLRKYPSELFVFCRHFLAFQIHNLSLSSL